MGDQIVKGTRCCLRQPHALPGGTEQQVLAWVERDPRPNFAVIIVETQTPDRDEVWFMLEGSRETFRLPTVDFIQRYQLVTWDPPRAEQVPPERPPGSQQEWEAMRLAGW